MFSARQYRMAANKIGVEDYRRLVESKLHAAGDLPTFDYAAFPSLGSTDAGLGFKYVLTIPPVDTPSPPTITLILPFHRDGWFSLAFPTAYKFQSARYEFTAVPEPGTAAPILMGFAGVVFRILARRLFRGLNKFGAGAPRMQNCCYAAWREI
jgi:hypothetical protein